MHQIQDIDPALRPVEIARALHIDDGPVARIEPYLARTVEHQHRTIIAIGHPSRPGGAFIQKPLDIFRLLVETGSGGLSAGRIAEPLGVPSETLSFHLH